MATSPYFNQYSQRARTMEQLLVEDLLNEAIKIHGTDVYYIVRESEDDFDPLFGEDPLAYFQRAYAIEMFIVDVDSFRGDGEFLSKFGLEARQGANLLVTQRSWNKYIPQIYAARPREGDLIWVPVFGKMFEIKFVDKDKDFYQLGRRDAYFFELYTEMWKFPQAKVNTGVEEIDDSIIEDTYTIRLTMNATSSNDYIVYETVYQGANLSTATATANVTAWTRSTGNLDLIHIKGVIQPGQNVIGVTSNTRYSTISLDPQDDFVFYDTTDNKQLQTEGNTILNFSETNPFGTP